MDEHDEPATLPLARLIKSRWRFSVVWVVPILAAIVAGYLLYTRIEAIGPSISIKFNDASGLRPGLTHIEYRGVAIGQVTSVQVCKDGQCALVKAQLQQSAAGLARRGSIFWIVRPRVGNAGITGLGTVITGPYISVQPGGGPPSEVFVAAESAPVEIEKGLNIVLTASRLGPSLQSNSPIYYRGVQVGTTHDADLDPSGSKVRLQAFIREPYVKLVNSDSKFWMVSGIQANFGLFSGLKVNVESVKTLLGGGIEFATPNGDGRPVKNGKVFTLFDKPEPGWLTPSSNRKVRRKK